MAKYNVEGIDKKKVIEDIWKELEKTHWKNSFENLNNFSEHAVNELKWTENAREWDEIDFVSFFGAELQDKKLLRTVINKHRRLAGLPILEEEKKKEESKQKGELKQKSDVGQGEGSGRGSAASSTASSAAGSAAELKTQERKNTQEESKDAKDTKDTLELEHDFFIHYTAAELYEQLKSSPYCYSSDDEIATPMENEFSTYNSLLNNKFSTMSSEMRTNAFIVAFNPQNSEQQSKENEGFTYNKHGVKGIAFKMYRHKLHRSSSSDYDYDYLLLSNGRVAPLTSDGSLLRLTDKNEGKSFADFIKSQMEQGYQPILTLEKINQLKSYLNAPQQKIIDNAVYEVKDNYAGKSKGFYGINLTENIIQMLYRAGTQDMLYDDRIMPKADQERIKKAAKDREVKEQQLKERERLRQENERKDKEAKDKEAKDRETKEKEKQAREKEQKEKAAKEKEIRDRDNKLTDEFGWEDIDTLEVKYEDPVTFEYMKDPCFIGKAGQKTGKSHVDRTTLLALLLGRMPSEDIKIEESALKELRTSKRQAIHPVTKIAYTIEDIQSDASFKAEVDRFRAYEKLVEGKLKPGAKGPTT